MATYFWVGGSGTWNSTNAANWSSTSGGAGGVAVPNAADIVNFDANSGASAVVTVDASVVAVFRVVIDKSDLFLSLSGNSTITVPTGRITLTSGTINLSNNVLTCGTFFSSNANTRVINFGAGEIVLTGNNTTVWTSFDSLNFSYTGSGKIVSNYSGSTGTRTFQANNNGGTESNALNFFVNGGTDGVVFGSNSKPNTLDLTGWVGVLTSDNMTVFGDYLISSGTTVTTSSPITFAATSGVQQIATNGVTINRPVVINAPSATIFFQDAFTQSSSRQFTITNGTVQFKNSATSTVGAFATSGTTQKFLQSTVAGSQATLFQASGTVSVSYLTIKDINATGGATWNAFVSQDNVNVGNNTGWDFFSQIGRYIYTRRKNKRILL